RRRHTISKRDWSSDVCSSDLLARFYGRTGQNNAVHLAAVECLDCLGHGEIGLSSTCRTDTKDDRVGIDRIDVDLLVVGLWADLRSEERRVGRVGRVQFESVDD